MSLEGRMAWSDDCASCRTRERTGALRLDGQKGRMDRLGLSARGWGLHPGTTFLLSPDESLAGASRRGGRMRETDRAIRGCMELLGKEHSEAVRGIEQGGRTGVTPIGASTVTSIMQSANSSSTSKCFTTISGCTLTWTMCPRPFLNAYR